MCYLNQDLREGWGCKLPKVKDIGRVKHSIDIEGHLKIACSSNADSARRWIDVWAAGMCYHITMMVREPSYHTGFRGRDHPPWVKRFPCASSFSQALMQGMDIESSVKRRIQNGFPG